MRNGLPLWEMAVAAAQRRHPEESDGPLLWRRAANELLGMAIADVRGESARRLADTDARSALQAQGCERRLMGHSDDFGAMVAQLHAYLYENMYLQEDVNWHVRRATELLGKVFDALLERPERVPSQFAENAETPHRAVCDFVQGMTDRYVDAIAKELGVLPAY